MKRVAITLTFLLTCCRAPGFAQQVKNSASVQALPLCAVIADASKYDGKEVVVRGLYRMVIHGAILMDRSCSKAEVNLRQASRYKTSKQASALIRSLTKKNEFEAVDVVFRGTLRVAHEGQCFGQICASYEIETTELVSASPESPKNQGPLTQR